MPKLARRAMDFPDARYGWNYPSHKTPDIMDVIRERDRVKAMVQRLVLRYTLSLVALTLCVGALAYLLLA